mgnify:CR=1 FL=1
MAGDILKRLRLPGRLGDPDIKDLSLVKRAANKEKVIMAKSKESDDPQTYDFSEVNDKTKSAIALAHEAVKDKDIMDSLPDEVGEFFKSAAKELDLDVEIIKAEHPEPKDGESDEEKKKRLENLKKAQEEADEKKKTEMIKSAFPGVLEAAQKVVVEPLQTEIKKAQDDLTEMRDKLQRDDMRIFARDMIPGDDQPSDEKVDELITIKKSMDDKSWKTYTESQRGLVTQIEKSALFERQASPVASSAGSAYSKLEEIVKSTIEKSEDKDQSKAWDHVIKTNPVLYEQYRTEQAVQAKVGSASQ